MRMLASIATSAGLLLATPASFGQNATLNNDLVFGAVFPGIPKTVAKYTAGSAMEFVVTGTAGDEITLDFDLPRYMSDGSYNMQMIFTETDCAIDTSGSPDQSDPEFDDLDPWHTLTYRLGSSGLTVWLGGTVVPGMGQPPGDYSAAVVLTVAYTGN